MRNNSTTRESGFGLFVFGAILLVAIGILVAYSPKAGVVVALVPLAVWLVGKAREPVLPWIAIVGIVSAGITLPGRIPLADLSCALALALCINQRVEWPTRLPRQMVVLLVLVFCAVLLSVALDHPPLNGADKRVFHIGTYALLIGAIATGRIRSENLVRGIRIGLGLGLVSGLAGLAGVGYFDKYPGRLTGIFADPNVASLVAVGLGMVAMNFARTSRERWSLAVLMALIVALSLSRTGVLALVLAFGWYLWVHRAPRSVGVGLVVAGVVIAIKLPQTVQTAGPFSIHAQSSGLRNLINQASNHQVSQHYLTGTGAGTASIKISNGTQFFFHNSYAAMIAEFGLPMTLIMASLLALTAVTLWRSQPRAPAIEAALLAVLVLALTLGEVIFTFTAAIVVGVAWRHILLARDRDSGAALETAESEPSASSVPGRVEPAG